jgi:hypothetical protein
MSTSNPSVGRFRSAAAIFLAVMAMLLAVHANRMVATNDEGILLDAAQRVAGGERPYVDFWAYMTPGSYWLQACLFKLFGISLLTARLIVIFDFALQCALVFWLTSKLASLRAAWMTTVAFLGFQMADPSFLTAQHRWDSSTWALAGVAIAVSASGTPAWIACGAILAVAAWCTPTVGMVLLVVALWLAFQPERRKSLIPLIGGAAIPFAAGGLLLIVQGGLIPMVQQILWLRKNYMVNAMPYGSIIGGYGALFEGSSDSFEFAIRVLLVSCVALPAILPPVALLSWGWLLARRKISDAGQRSIAILMLAAGLALILALSPRPDVMHLAFVVAIPYILAAAAFSKLIPNAIRVPVGLFAGLMAIVFSLNSFVSLGSLASVPSPVGELRVENKQSAAMGKLLATVHPGEPLFVYPYMPMHYFITQAHNPTEYSFFSPGMSTQREANAALAELQQRPPEWILFLKLSREEILRVIPQGGSAELNYGELETWLEQNYAPLSSDRPGDKIIVSGYELRRRVPTVQASVR